MTVGRRMTRNPITVKEETPVIEAQNRMRKEKIHRFPVLNREGRLAGIVTEKDLLYASPSPATTLDVYEMSYLLSKLNVGKVMTHKVQTVTEDTLIEDAARIMADNNIGGLPVLRGTEVVGIITESDIFKVFIEMFAAREAGVRASLIVPSKKGEIAEMATAINAVGGNILALGTFLGEEASSGFLTLKVSEISADQLRQVVGPFVKEIVDIRDI